MIFSKRHAAVICVLLGMTGIVSCNSQNTRVSDSSSAVPNKAEYAGCIEPTIAELEQETQRPAEVAQKVAKNNTQDEPVHETADCTLPELAQ